MVLQKLSRRSFLKAATAATVAGTIGHRVTPISYAGNSYQKGSGVVDLTHRLVKTFPSFLGPQAVFDEVQFTIEDNGFFAKEWTFYEHIGTHIDAPGHFSLGGKLVDELDPETFIVPIVVVDISAKAENDPNSTVEPSDLIAFERRFGRIPADACVAMYSGWDQKVADGDEFRGGTGFPDLNFPGFGIDAIEWLLENRNILGIAVDTLSLDPGNSSDFPVHINFLATGRWGLENVANLGKIPPRGATIFVGVIPWEEGSGGPCRVIAQVRGRGDDD
jgi:kynurenine formamidase